MEPIYKLTTKSLYLLKVNEIFLLTSNFIGDPQSYPGIDRSPPIRPPRDWIQSLSDEEKQTIGDIAERFHGKCKT